MTAGVLDRECVLRLEVASRELLEWLINEPLPAGFHEMRSSVEAFRVLHFDGPGRDLARRGASIRLRIDQDGTRTLKVELRECELRPGVIRSDSVEATVEDVAAPELFAGDTEPARLIRALTDPGRLTVSMELETYRRVRRVAVPEDPGACARVMYDIVTVRFDDLVGDLCEIEVRAPLDERFDPLLNGFEAGRGLRPALGDVATRAQDRLAELQLNQLAETVRGSREVAIIASCAGRVALHRDGAGRIRLPGGPGAGRDAARRALREWFDSAAGRIRVIGTAPGSAHRPALEVWVAEEFDRGSADSRWVWVRLEDLLRLAGSARLRDERTLAALAVVAASDLPSRAAAAASPALQKSQSAALQEPLELVARDPDEGERIGKEVRPELLLNRELGRLAFDERILVMAEDPAMPLLERIRFLGLFGARQDDFFMTRVAESKEYVAAGLSRLTPDGLTPTQQLELIRIRAREIAGRAYRLLTDVLLPELAAHGHRVLRWTDLDEAKRAELSQRYWRHGETMVTPLVADPSHPFPHIRNLRPAIAVELRLPGSRVEHLVAIELPSELPRFLPVDDGKSYLPVEEVIVGALPRLYPGAEVVRAHTFRVTRSATTRLEPESNGDVLVAVEDELSERPFRQVVRLEVEAAMPQAMRAQLLRELRFESPEAVTTLGLPDIFEVPWLVDLATLSELARLDIPELRYRPLSSRSPIPVKPPIFDVIKERDRLIHFPEHSFDSTVGRFLSEAADDPAVRSIKLTLYRTDPDSEIVRALARARAAGKEAFALVELKASFDERRNIEWARALDAAGVHVVFSPARYKTHAKIALVVRREGRRLVRYAYVGTGNLNAVTAGTYTDVGILSADPAIGREVNAVFNILTGYAAAAPFRRLLVAPFQMRRRFLELIERETRNARAGRRSGIQAQLNGLSDRRIIAALYRASQAGVPIQLAVREICRLRPGVPGVSDNIRVVSVLGRLLRHSRIFRFENGGRPEYFIGSADWRPRNLLRRVEVAVPITDPRHKTKLRKLLGEILHHPDAWELRPDGSYVRGDEVVGGLPPGLH